MKIFWKIAAWFTSLLTILVLIAGTAAGIKYYRVTHSDAAANLISGPELPDEEDAVTLGQKINMTAAFRIPWGIQPALLTVDPAKGSQLTGEPYWKKIKTGWGYSLWQGIFPIQAIHEGVVKEAPGTASFSNSKTISLKIPSFDVKPPKIKGDQLEIAGAIDYQAVVEQNRKMWIFVIAGILIFAVIGYLICYKLKRPKAHYVTPWEKALTEISDLLASIHAGKTLPEQSVARLTDIVREYLEERFSLRAERQTTPEFLSELEQNKKNLSDSQHNFLREFLTVADMVKFAKLPADHELLENAAGKAEDLIRETMPADKEKENLK